MSENPPAAMRLTPWTSAVYGLGLFLLTFLLALLYQEAVVHSVTRWNTLGGSHAPLILAVSLYLIWIQREKLREMGPKPALLSGGLLLAAGCFVLFAGKISSTMLVQQISIVPVLLGLILVLGGFSYMTIFLLPIGYLLFLTGLVDHLLGEFSLFFQQTTAWLAAVLLALLGFSVFQEGTLIQLPHILLHVVRECNGVNQIMSLLALAVPLGYMTQRTWTRQIVLVMSALVIGLLINGLRVAMIGVYALYNHGADLHGPAGTLSAMVVFFFGLVVLIMFNMLLARIGRKHKSSPGVSSSPDPAMSAQKGPGSASFRKRLGAFATAFVLLAGTYGLVHSFSLSYTAPSHLLSQLPDAFAGFTSHEVNVLPDRIRPFPADKELMRRYEDGQGNTVTLYIGYLGLQDRKKKLIDYRRTWMHERLSKVEINTGNAALEINKTELRGQSNGSDLYFWYQMGGRIIRSEYVGKLVTFVHALVYGENSGAVVVLKARGKEESIQGFLTEAVPRIHDLLSSS